MNPRVVQAFLLLLSVRAIASVTVDFRLSPFPDTTQDILATSENLSGTLPNTIGRFASLTNLDLSTNAITGAIPSQLARCTNLIKIRFQNNQLSGAIPQQLGLLTALTSIEMLNNQLTGQLSTFFPALSALEIFDMRSNLLSGTIPLNLSPRLQSLLLSHNPISGTIPSLVSLNLLLYFDVSSCQLSGSAPHVSDISGPTYLGLGENFGLSGDLPQEYIGLAGLNISSTSLTMSSAISISVKQQICAVTVGCLSSGVLPSDCTKCTLASLTPTPSPSGSSSQSPTPVPPSLSISPTVTLVAASSSTPSALPTQISSPSSSPSTPAGTPSFVPSQQGPKASDSATPSHTVIAESTSPTSSPSVSPSKTPSNTPSRSTSPTVTPTNSPSTSVSPSTTPSNTPSRSTSPTVTPTNSPSTSVTPSTTPSNTPSRSTSPTVTPTNSPSTSVSPSTTLSTSVTPSTTPSNTPSRSTSPTVTPTNSPSTSTTPSTTPSTSSSQSTSPTVTPTNSPSTSVALSTTPSNTPSASVSPSTTLSNTPSTSPSVTPTGSTSTSVTPSTFTSPSVTPTGSSTTSSSPSTSPSPSQSKSSTKSPSFSPSTSQSKSPSATTSLSSTFSPSVSASTQPTKSPTASSTSSQTQSSSASQSPSPTFIPLGSFSQLSFVDQDGAAKVLGGDLTFVWQPFATTRTTARVEQFQVGVVDENGGTRLVGQTTVDANFDFTNPVRIVLGQLEMSSQEVSSSGEVTLTVMAMAPEGDNTASDSLTVPDYVIESIQAIVSVATTSVTVAAVASVSVSISAVSAGSAGATAAATTAATTTAATTSTTATATATTTSAAGGGGATGGAASGGGNVGGAGLQGPPMSVLVTQLQFMAMTSYQRGSYPSTYRELSKSFAWTTLNFGVPNPSNAQTHSSGRTTKSATPVQIEQVPTYLKLTPEQLLENTVVVLCVVLVLLLVSFVGVTVWKHLTGKKRLFGQTRLRSKLACLTIRVLRGGSFGLNFAAINELRSGNNSAHTALAALILIFFGVGVPVMHMLVYLVDRGRIQIPTRFDGVASRLSAVYRPMLADFRPEMGWFMVMKETKDLITSVNLVLFSSSTIQSYAMLFLYAAYFGLLALRPYKSKLMFRLDLTVSLINCIVLCVPLVLHYFPSLYRVSAMQWVLVGLQMSIVLLYMLYTCVVLVRQISLRSTSWGAIPAMDMTEFPEDDEGYQSDCANPSSLAKATRRKSADFYMEPRHKQMWADLMLKHNLTEIEPATTIAHRPWRTTVTETSRRTRSSMDSMDFSVGSLEDPPEGEFVFNPHRRSLALS